MSAVNNCTFIGYVTQTPVMSTTPEEPVARFMIMVSERSEGHTSKPAQWIPVAAWHDLAACVVQMLHKGDQVSVTGRWSQQQTGVELELEDFSDLGPRPRTSSIDEGLDFADEY